jgi:hypothetical protein
MEEIEQDSYSYYRLHEKIALVSLLKKEMRKHSTLKKCSGINCDLFLHPFIFQLSLSRQFNLYTK